MPIEYENMPGMQANRQPQIEKKESFLTNFVIKNKLAKDYKGAQIVLFIAALVFFALSIFFFLR